MYKKLIKVVAKGGVRQNEVDGGRGGSESSQRVSCCVVLLTAPYECNYLFKTKNKDFNVKKEDG